MAWATEAEVLALTGTTVSAAHLTQAQGHIELYSGVVDGVTDLTVRDTRLLHLAVAYQAAWLVSQIDVASRLEVTSIDQDGAKVVPVDGDALLLAPLARRALTALSWRTRTGTITVSAGVARYRTWDAYADAWVRDATPDHCWRPM